PADHGAGRIVQIEGWDSASMNQFALDEAAQIFTDLIDIAPDFAEAWNKRATVLYMMGKYDQSTADVRETLRLEPRHFGALSGQGLIYMETGKQAEALHWFRRALEVNPFMEGVQQNVKLLEDALEGRVI
ncbi:MAG: tetratricopeptide repeat protein, partial [Gammaproteobacteria bacterium]|nr:tetratricopeptide repeat protein [Gammaproteobacteria bacterium]